MKNIQNKSYDEKNTEGKVVKMNNKKLHIELIRIIAIVMVALNHSDLFYTYYSNTENSITFSVSLFISSICKINVPLFMMITGALLIPKAETWRNILKKRVSRMLVVLVFFSGLMYGLQCFVWNQNVFSISEFIRKLFTNDIQTSYWYLYEYIGILVMLPFVGVMARNLDRDCMKYFLELAIIFKVGLSVLGLFIEYSIPIDLFVLENSVFYVLMGYYLENTVGEDECKKISYIKLILGVAISICVTIVMVLTDKGMRGEYHENVLSIMTPVMAALIYIGIRKICIDYSNMKFANILKFLGSCTFGVYLLEHIGQKVFIKMYLELCDRTFGVIACLIYVICILVFCFGVVGIVKKMKLLDKII